jgi:undecaprenyl-diphosphatase
MSLCISGGLAWILAKILKILFNTPRPFDVFPKVQSLFVETGQAFPSGHTMVASAIAFTVFSIHKRVGYIFMGLAVLVGLSRIISGVHFPIDILGGFIFGALVANFVKNR